jgi:hypothetical protein
MLSVRRAYNGMRKNTGIFLNCGILPFNSILVLLESAHILLPVFDASLFDDVLLCVLLLGCC